MSNRRGLEISAATKLEQVYQDARAVLFRTHLDSFYVTKCQPHNDTWEHSLRNRTYFPLFEPLLFRSYFTSPSNLYTFVQLLTRTSCRSRFDTVPKEVSSISSPHYRIWHPTTTTIISVHHPAPINHPSQSQTEKTFTSLLTYPSIN